MADLQRINANWDRFSEAQKAELRNRLTAEEKTQLVAMRKGAAPVATPQAEPKSQGGFLSGVYDTTIGPLVEMGKAAEAKRQTTQQEIANTPGLLNKVGVAFRSGVENLPQVQAAKMAGGILSNSANQLGQARDLYRQGDYTGAVGRAAAAVPIVGPLADQVTDTAITADNLPKAAGQLTGILGSAFAPKIATASKPVLSRATAPVARGLRASGERAMETALSATTKGNKIRTQNVVPRLVDERFTASSAKNAAAQAKARVQAVGQQIDDAFNALPDEAAVPLQPIAETLANRAIQKATVPGPNGTRIPANPQAEKMIANAEDLVRRLGDAGTTLPDGSLSISVRALRRFKQEFDEIGKQAGRFEGKTLADQSSAASQALAGDVARDALNTAFPEIAALNKDFSFWKNVQQVAADAALRKTGQTHAVTKGIFQATGAGLGANFGGPVGAIAGGYAGGKLAEGLYSPAFLTQRAAKQAAMADRIAKFNPAPYGILGPVSLGQQGILSQGDR